ncbi:MAG: adenylate/guanylate cyclase domain-containing protein [Spirochaetaceae bacterium]
MADVLEKVLGKKIAGTRVVPLMLKIVVIFFIFLLVSNFVSNYINLMLNRGEQIRLLNQLLVKDLKDLTVFANNQHEIYSFNEDLEAATRNLVRSSERNHQGSRALSAGITREGEFFFAAHDGEVPDRFGDSEALSRMNSNLEEGIEEEAINFEFQGNQYFGVYKYNNAWEVFLLRSEELNEFYADSERIFRNVSLIILGLTVVSAAVGILLISHILRFVSAITNQIMAMQEGQKLDLLSLRGAPNDEISYLGVAFNSLASTIDNLMTIFKKFVARDVAAKAYREREIRLEGERRVLTILFTDIKSFTFMTETLGTDIIKLLNLHYDRAIRYIHEHNGDIGSIIGDALLAVFGVMEEDRRNKSFAAVEASYRIQEVAASLREEMHKRKEEILRKRGSLTEAEENVYRAVLLEVGVGIDGGEVFYGNIGSYERMVNTVIGDNVNSSSRLEGLTRFYKVPVITSRYVKEETEQESDKYWFVELDRVQVKGKTEGKSIYWPVIRETVDDQLEKDFKAFDEGLHLYYDGDWRSAEKAFQRCTLGISNTFLGRIKGREAPANWNGVWTMKEK